MVFRWLRLSVKARAAGRRSRCDPRMCRIASRCWRSLFVGFLLKISLRRASRVLIGRLARPRLARPTTKGMATACPSLQLSTDQGQWGQRIGSSYQLTTRPVVLLGQTDSQESLRLASNAPMSGTARPRVDSQSERQLNELAGESRSRLPSGTSNDRRMDYRMVSPPPVVGGSPTRPTRSDRRSPFPGADGRVTKCTLLSGSRLAPLTGVARLSPDRQQKSREFGQPYDRFIARTGLLE